MGQSNTVTHIPARFKAFFRHARCFAADRIPAQLVIQWTTHCNARCPQCGMRTEAHLARRHLPVDDVKRMLDAAASNHVQAVSFTGGEPLLFRDELLELIQYAGRLGIPYIRTGTNGFMFRNAHTAVGLDRIKRFIEQLAATPIRNFWISLDSSIPGVHEQMRGLPGVVEGIARVLPLFHAAGIYPAANLGINRNVGGSGTADLHPDQFGSPEAYLQSFYHQFRNAFDRFYRFVHALGFSMVNTCYPMSINAEHHCDGLSAVYAATAGERLVSFSSSEKAMLYRALLHTISAHRSRLRIFSPLTSLYALSRQYGRPDQTAAFGCRGGIDFFFVSADDGDTYPCGYRGRENLGKFWHLNMKELRPGRDCLRCDWECFRDPSEMCGPILLALRSPLRLIRRIAADPAAYRLWLQDISYYHACHLFDGRRPIDVKRLRYFAPSPSAPLPSTRL
jgi:MoaA/NifB/PqqE/SkfB family radical SAM enzyme